MPVKAKRNIKAKKASRKSVKKIDTEKTERKRGVRRTYLFAVGRRKSSVARVRYYKKGEKEIFINDKPFDKYFTYLEFQNIIRKPLLATGLKEYGKFSIKVRGGGKRGQAEAIMLGVARALELLDNKYRKILKVEGLLRRDPRVKERKKYGLKRARRAPQWQKR